MADSGPFKTTILTVLTVPIIFTKLTTLTMPTQVKKKKTINFDTVTRMCYKGLHYIQVRYLFILALQC